MRNSTKGAGLAAVALGAVLGVAAPARAQVSLVGEWSPR
jgi:hypothetical protein